MIREHLQRSWNAIARFFSTLVICLLYRVRVYGRENVPKAGPVLLLSNHQSFLDPIFVQSTIWRNFYFVARESLYTIKFFGTLISTLNTIPIKRGTADLSAMKKIMGKLKENRCVCLFPEATRTSDGRIADIKPGFGLLSRRSGAKVMPVVIDGAFECWPRHKKLPSIGKVTVSYGKAIPAEQVKEMGDKEFARLLTAELRRMQNERRIARGLEGFDYCSCEAGDNAEEKK